MKNLLSITALIFIFGCTKEPSMLEKCMKKYTPKLNAQEIADVNFACDHHANVMSLKFENGRLVDNEFEWNRIKNECEANMKVRRLNAIRGNKSELEDRAEKFCNSQGIY